MPTKRPSVAMPKSEPEQEQLSFDEPEPELVKDLGAVDTPPEEDLEEDEEEYRPFMVEDMDPTTELWPNGPTAGDIVKMKEAFGDVYFTAINLDEHFIWRCIERDEWGQIELNFENALERGESQTMAMMTKQDALTELCVLWPHLDRMKMRKIKAGVPALIYQQVLEASGFVSIDVRQL